MKKEIDQLCIGRTRPILLSVHGGQEGLQCWLVRGADHVLISAEAFDSNAGSVDYRKNCTVF